MPDKHALFTVTNKLVRILVAGYLLTAFAASAEDTWDETELSRPQVNEGELIFLALPPDKPIHHHQHWLTVTAQSLEDGWVKLRQCHQNMDPVALAEITFRQDKIRNLAIFSRTNVGAARVEGATIQLEDIGADASICITAELNSLIKLDQQHYQLTLGPFMRRFLDGYYPMHVSVWIDYRRTRLQLTEIQPPEQAGFRMEQGNNQLYVDAWFEGRLNLQISFTTNQVQAIQFP